MIVAERHEQVAAATLPRERLLRFGADTLRDAELIAVVLGSGVHGRSVHRLAEDVLRLLDRGHPPPSAATLMQLTGLGEAKAGSLCAAFELSRRILCPAHRRIAIPADLVPMVSHYAERNKEYFLCASLNGAHEVHEIRVVTIGLVNRTMVHPREVFADPITDRAAAVIVAHNHPSGSVTPSSEDRTITRRLVEAGSVLGIPVLDHVVFSVSDYFSFLENGLLS